MNKMSNNMNPHYIENCNTIYLNNPSNWHIKGYSKAGERTSFMLYPLKILLDAGVMTKIAPKAIVITHSHTDHTYNLPNILNNGENIIKGQEQLTGKPVYMPKTCIEPIELLMKSVIMLSNRITTNNNINNKIDDKSRMELMNNSEYIHKKKKYHPIEVKPGDLFNIPGIPNIKMEILQAYHSTECVGYGFTSIKRKLKEEYHGKNKDIIIDAKKKGLQIDEETSVPELLYFCDSTIKNFTDHDEWKKYPVIMCECTGFPETHDADVVMSRYHTHLEQLEPIIKANKNINWILIHTSCLVDKEILDKHEKRLKNENINIQFVEF